MRKLSICTLALCLGFASITHASSVTKVKVKGNSAGGGTSTVEDPCFYFSFSFNAFDQVTKDGTNTPATKELSFSVFGFDNCTEEYYTANVTVPLTIPIANQSSLSLPFDFLVDVYPSDSEELLEQRRLVGNVTITATGDFQKSRQTNITQTATTRQVVRTKSNARQADVTATATFDGVPVNFDPDAGGGEIGTTSNGTIEITRY